MEIVRRVRGDIKPIVSAARQSWAPSTSTCTPLLRRTDGRAPGFSSLRTRSTHGPVALTIEPACTVTVRPSTSTSAPPLPIETTSA